MKFVSSRRGKTLCLHGINARVVKAGRVETGDTIRGVSRVFPLAISPDNRRSAFRRFGSSQIHLYI